MNQVDLQSAQVLLREGMLEEAKEVLLALRLRHPESAQIADLLHEVHDKELEQIVERDPVPGSKATGDDVVRILERLETDLELDLVKGLGDDAQACQLIVRDLERSGSLDSRTRIDLAIGFMGMGLFRVVEMLLSQGVDESFQVAATCLKAEALLGRKRPFDAVLSLDHVVHNENLSLLERCNVLYLLGRSYEALGEGGLAKNWYQSVQELMPGFRDVSERLAC